MEKPEHKIYNSLQEIMDDYQPIIDEKEAKIKELKEMDANSLFAGEEAEEILKLMEDVTSLKKERSHKITYFFKKQERNKLTAMEKTPQAIYDASIQYVESIIGTLNEHAEGAIKEHVYNDFYVSDFLILPDELPQEMRKPGIDYYYNSSALMGYLHYYLNTYIEYYQQYGGNYSDLYKGVHKFVMDNPHCVTVARGFVSLYEAYSIVSLPYMYEKEIAAFMNELTPEYIRSKIGTFKQKEITEILAGRFDRAEIETATDILSELKDSHYIDLADLARFYKDIMQGRARTDSWTNEESDEATDERENINTHFPSEFIFPMDKINNVIIWNNKKPSQDPVTYQYNFSKTMRGKIKDKDAVTSVTLSFPGMTEEQNNLVLNGHFRMVHSAALSQFKRGNTVMNDQMIYEAMTGDIDNKITDQWRTTIRNCMYLLFNSWLIVDDTKELKKVYGKTGKIKEGHIVDGGMERNFLNGNETDTYKIRNFMLYDTADEKDQVLTLAIDSMNIPGVQGTPFNMSIISILLRNIYRINGKHTSNKINLAEIYKELEIEGKTNERKLRSSAIKTIISSLDHWKKTKFIKNYKIETTKGETWTPAKKNEQKRGVTLGSIVIYPVTKKTL